jgi:hypothetical protein
MGGSPDWRRPVKPCRVSGGKKPLTVSVELAVLYAQFDLVGARRQIEPGVGDPGIVGIADQIERRQPRINIEPGHSQDVIMKPQGGGLLSIWDKCKCWSQTLCLCRQVQV